MVPQKPVQIERVYDDDGSHGGYRVLVDRLWPRGVKKNDLSYDEWMKDVAPSDGLRHWYGHDPERYAEFARRYRSELRTSPARDQLSRLRQLSTRRRVVLLTATKDVAHSGAEVLRKVLERAQG
jgi:uncharacterized protein YeaO (DUF488 family)